MWPPAAGILYPSFLIKTFVQRPATWGHPYEEVSMKRSAFLGILFSLTLASTAAFAASRVEYILDVSGSMNALAAGEKRIDAAKKALTAMVQGIPDGSTVALRLYSHRVSPQDKAASCKDTELVIPFGPISKQQFINTVNATVPLGQTPIAYSLEQASLDFTPGADEQQTIILVSDGEESCGGDPVAVAKALIAKGFKIKINVIGFDVDAAAKNQLAAIASSTGGQYFDVKDAAGLTGSLQKLTQESLVIQKAGASTYGEEIRGGDNYETAVALPAGKLFRLNHHQRQNQYDYFYVDAKPGQNIVLSLETGEKSVDIKADNTYDEGSNPYAGIGLHSPTKVKFKHEEIIGGKNDARQLKFSVPSAEPGRYFILVGSAYDHQHKDHRFKVDFVEQYDAGSQQDAGDTQPTALAVQPGTHKAFLAVNDTVDTYKFTVAPGSPVTVKVRPVNDKANLRLWLYDSDGVELARVSAPNEGAVARIENTPNPRGGETILKVDTGYSNIDTEYSLEINTGGTAVAALPSPAPGAPAAPLAPAPLPAATTTTTTVAPAPIMKPIVQTGGEPTSRALCEGFKTLPLMEKLKFLGFWNGIPLFAGGLIGFLWGYLKGRKSGKRWAARQAEQMATKPPASAPKP